MVSWKPRVVSLPKVDFMSFSWFASRYQKNAKLQHWHTPYSAQVYLSLFLVNSSHFLFTQSVPSSHDQVTDHLPSCHLPWWSLSLFLSNNDDPTEKWRTADQVIIEDWNISKWFWEKKPWLSRANCEVVLALNQSELWFPDGMRLIVDFMAVFQYRWL